MCRFDLGPQLRWAPHVPEAPLRRVPNRSERVDVSPPCSSDALRPNGGFESDRAPPGTLDLRPTLAVDMGVGAVRRETLRFEDFASQLNGGAASGAASAPRVRATCSDHTAVGERQCAGTAD